MTIFFTANFQLVEKRGKVEAIVTYNLRRNKVKPIIIRDAIVRLRWFSRNLREFPAIFPLFLSVSSVASVDKSELSTDETDDTGTFSKFFVPGFPVLPR